MENPYFSFKNMSFKKEKLLNYVIRGEKMNKESLIAKENMAKMFSIIKSRISFLTDEEIKDILKKIDLTKKYTIVVTKDESELIEYLTEIKYKGYNDNLGNEEYERTEVKILYGNQSIEQIGYCYISKYYENGNLIEESNEEVMPKFDKTKPLIVLFEKYLYSNTNKELYFNERRFLVFFKGKN